MTDLTSQVSVYNKLTPISDADLAEYEAALLYALTEKDIRNIAVTGVYGSGKSSLIKSFEEKCKNDNDYKDKNFNFLNVSLASFDLEQNPNFKDDDTSSEKSKKNETQDIEKSLLQQIIFKVKSDELEDSQFSRIKIKRYIRICKTRFQFLVSHFWTAFFVVAMLLITKFVFKPDYFLFKDSWLFKQQFSWVYEVILLTGFMGVVQLIFNWVPRLGLSKFSAGGAEISFNEKRGDSILNKHLDELIYFFATTRFNIVVFEDLDRLPTREILIKLREINQLINNSEEINELGINKVVKFVFALGDDLFTDAIDRTKFFDFILPVIPVVNYSNSREKLEAAIKKAFPDIQFRPNFLDEVTQFLGDMRLLFNVANEFIIYKKRLDAKESESKDKLTLDDNKLLAMIVYKNKYPDDFAKLNQRQGKVWDVLATKDTLITSLKNGLLEKITQAKKSISDIDAEKLKDINDLRRVYLGFYLEKYPEFSHFQINGNIYYPHQFLESDSVIDLLRTQRDISYIMRGIRSPQTLDNFANIEKEFDPKLTYDQRKESLIKKADGTLSALNSEIASLEKDLHDLDKISFNQLVLKHSDLPFKDLKADDGLIRYLISDGLIEEDYLAYTTYFYPGELSINDQQYMTAQLSNVPLGFGYQLDNPEKVFKKIKDGRFKSRAILNLNMLTYSSLKHSDSDKFANIINAILDAKEAGYEFVSQWLKLPNLSDISKKSFLNAITKIDEHYWAKLLDATDVTSEERGSLVIALLEHLDQRALSLINHTGFIQLELNEHVEYFNSIVILGYTKLVKLFNFLNVKFASLEKCNDNQLLEVIEKSNAYELTVDNLVKILSRTQTSEINVVPTYTYINTYGSNAVKDYINNEIRWFAGDVLQNLEGAEESEQSAIGLLNNSTLDTELILSLIHKLDFNIRDIESITDIALWPDLIHSKRVEANWINVIKYFKYVDQEIDDALLNFLNDEAAVRSLVNLKLQHNIADELAIARKIVRCDGLKDEIYKKLISAIAISFHNLSDLEVSAKKIELLLNSRKFALTVENHEFLKENLPNMSYLLIEQNFDKYLEDPTKFELSNSELVNLVANSNLSEIHKSNLIKLTPESTYDTPLAKAFCEFDISHSKDKLFNISNLRAIFSLGLAEELKIKLFNRYCDLFDHQAILDAIENISDEVAKLIRNAKPKLVKTDANWTFAKFLESKQYLSVREDKKGSDQIILNPRKIVLK